MVANLAGALSDACAAASECGFMAREYPHPGDSSSVACGVMSKKGAGLAACMVENDEERGTKTGALASYTGNQKKSMRYVKMKMFKKIFVLGLATAVLMTGCGSIGGEALQLEDTSWKLVELDGQPILPNSEVTIQFDEGKAGGSSGCNSYNGEYTLEADGSIQFGPMASTMMACEQGLMDQEINFFQTLVEVTAAEIDDGRLTMEDGAGSVLLVFERAAE